MYNSHLLIPLIAFAAALLATRLAIAYGLRRQLIDEPGGRRLHTQPTVRGAGIGMVVVMLVGLVWLAWLHPASARQLYTLAAALLLVAAVGWWDDHRPLPARWRLLVHLLAVAVLISPLYGAAGALLCLTFAIALTWLINAYNFIDGSDAFAAGHGLWIAGCCAIAAAIAGDALLAALCALIAASSAGFLYFNWPPARAFLGDVASGTLGLALGSVIVLSWERASLDPLLPILLMSGIVLDASLTLLWRMLSGRRWYLAHRSHLYQWLLRTGWTRQMVLLAYLGWSAGAACALLLLPESALVKMLGTIGILGIGSAVWALTRRRILQQARKGSHK